jgi:hypothetical protein
MSTVEQQTVHAAQGAAAWPMAPALMQKHPALATAAAASQVPPGTTAPWPARVSGLLFQGKNSRRGICVVHDWLSVYSLGVRGACCLLMLLAARVTCATSST